MEKDADFQKRLLATFMLEAEEHIRQISSALIGLEKAGPQEERMEVLERAFREAHSLKGAARAVDLADIEAVARSTEAVFGALKRKEIEPSPALFDLLHEAVGVIGRLLPCEEKTDEDRAAIHHVTHGLEAAAKAGTPVTEAPHREAAQAEPAPPPPPQKEEIRLQHVDAIRIATSKLTSLLLEAEQLISPKLALEHFIAELKEMLRSIGDWKKNIDQARRSVPRIQDLESQTVAADLQSLMIDSLEDRLEALLKLAWHNYHSLSGIVDTLLDDMKMILMLPFSSLVEIFPKMVRDLSREQGKEIGLTILGEDIDIDKRVLDEMKDPLIHLIRNCIDHGIEKPEERRQKGKPPKGEIRLTISRKDSGKIEITISDDGAGINVEKVRSASVRYGIVSKEEAEKMSDHEALFLIFRSGVTTSPIVTDISGRGLGLAIVQEKTARLNGTVSCTSSPSAGTQIRIVLPHKLATFRGVLIRLSEQLFVLPTANVDLVMRMNREEIRTVENSETIRIDGEVIPCMELKELLALPGARGEKDEGGSEHHVIVCSSGQRIAFIVNEVIGEQEVLVKGMGNQLSRVRNISGASLLGTGRVVPILNVHDLIKSAVKTSPATSLIPEEQGGLCSKRKAILVADDSITTRLLIGNILETAGYDVTTAVDGLDAFQKLEKGEFDLVVSDVAMPRMDGFEMTAKIRNHQRLSGTPVVLVTALESREEVERGMNAGANGYIIKRLFDQGNLLETVKKLIL